VTTHKKEPQPGQTGWGSGGTGHAYSKHAMHTQCQRRLFDSQRSFLGHGCLLNAAFRRAGRSMRCEQLSALPQHAAVGLKTLGNDGNCCIAEAAPPSVEIAVPVPPGATVAPGSVGVTDSKPTPVQGRPVSEFLPSGGWIKVLGSAGGTEISLRPERSVLFPLSTGLTVFPLSIGLLVFWASATVAVRMRVPTPISPMRSATTVNLHFRARPES